MLNNSMSQIAGCPNDEELAAFEAGALTPEQRQTIIKHLIDCTLCASSLKTLHANDTLVACLRHRPEHEQFLLNESACRELEDFACALAWQRTSTSTVPRSIAVPRDQALELPAVFGAYRLLELLGRGGMGIVYKAEQETLKRLAALKMVRAGIYATEEERARFQREGQAIARVRNDHVVQIYEFGEQAGQMFFAMELLEGGTLAGRLKGRPLEPRAAAELARTLARGVQAAHDQGIVHRDLKPSNVLFAADGTAKITDFGLAKIFDVQDITTQTDALLGTPSYMSPEQANGEVRKLGPAIDIYALGAILYEMLTGRPPFRGKTSLQTVELVRTREPEPPSRYRPELSRDLEAICLKCLEKEPARRYPSAAALGDDLDRWLRGEPTQARPPGRVRRTWRVVRRRGRTVAVVVLLIGLTVGAALMWWHTDPDRPLRDIERRLPRGETVVLIDQKGKPAWQSVPLGGETTQTSLGADGTFTVHSWSLALVELLRDPHRESYRLRAEVLHRNTRGDRSSIGAGIYIGDRQFPTPKGVAHSFVYWVFNDIYDLRARYERLRDEGKIFPGQPTPKGNRIELCSRVCLAGDLEHTWNWSGNHMGGYFEILPPSQMRRWRPITLEVTPRSLRGFWEGKLIGEMPLDRLTRSRQEYVDIFRAKFPDNPYAGLDVVRFSPRGGVGLFVHEGSAAFRNVVLEPLEEGK